MKNILVLGAIPKDAEGHGVKLSTFREWTERHKSDFVIDGVRR